MIIEPVILEETGNIKFNNSQLTIIKKYIYVVPLLKVGEEMVYYTKNKQWNKQTKNSFGIWRGSGWMGVTLSESFNVVLTALHEQTHTHTNIAQVHRCTRTACLSVVIKEAVLFHSWLWRLHKVILMKSLFSIPAN